MTFPDITASLKAAMPELRGRLMANQSLAELTWFRVGGPAQVLFMPEDENDLAYFVARKPKDVPVTVIGLGSNLIVRDGGVPGIVIRLGRGFSEVTVEDGYRIRAGTAVPDVKVARAAQEAGIAGLSFLRGIPGGIGGALRMNGGAYGGETKDRLIEARGVDGDGKLRIFTNADMGYSYRHCSVGDDVIFTQALFQGEAGDAADQEPHRRLDLQEPAGRQGLATDRRRRLPRPRGRQGAGVGTALQLSDQSRRRDSA
jgi:UDP-N-acetylmuramate dehydrogenase